MKIMLAETVDSSRGVKSFPVADVSKEEIVGLFPLKCPIYYIQLREENAMPQLW